MKEKEIQKVDPKKAKPKNGKPNFFVRIGRKLKEVFSEIKKVSWPTFPKVIKQTGIVIVVVLIFLVIITAFDFGLLQLMNLIR
jgi:preprotein translocase SecE subunit